MYRLGRSSLLFFFFFNDTATTEIYTLSLHDALPILTTSVRFAMPLAPKNLLVIMSDEHNRRVLGAAGHPLVHTPHLDRLSARGTRFGAAYCTSPICVPSRAGFATGKYQHQNGYWDNADPYD